MPEYGTIMRMTDFPSLQSYRVRYAYGTMQLHTGANNKDSWTFHALPYTSYSFTLEVLLMHCKNAVHHKAVWLTD